MSRVWTLVPFLGAMLGACVGAPKSPPAPPAKVLFFDDFIGPILNRSHWNVRTTGHVVNNEQQAYLDSDDVLETAHGVLAITARHRAGFVTADGKTFDFVSGRIDTRERFEFTYGTAAA